MRKNDAEHSLNFFSAPDGCEYEWCDFSNWTVIADACILLTLIEYLHMWSMWCECGYIIPIAIIGTKSDGWSRAIKELINSKYTLTRNRSLVCIDVRWEWKSIKIEFSAYHQLQPPHGKENAHNVKTVKSIEAYARIHSVYCLNEEIK